LGKRNGGDEECTVPAGAWEGHSHLPGKKGREGGGGRGGALTAAGSPEKRTKREKINRQGKRKVSTNPL